MMKFNLIVNAKHEDGFKLSVSSENEKELQVVLELTNNLISKIKQIEVKVNDNGDY